MVPKPNGGSPPDPPQDKLTIPDTNKLTPAATTAKPNHTRPVPITTQKITQPDNTNEKEDDEVTDMLIDTELPAPPVTNNITTHSPTITMYNTDTTTIKNNPENNPEKENKNNDAHDNTENTTAPNTEELEWIPIRVDWTNKSISMHSNIINNNINDENARDNKLMENHPIPLKLWSIVNIVQNRYPDSQMKTNKNTILTKETLIKKWTVNQVKHEFDYHCNTKRNKIITTLWLLKSPDMDLNDFRRPLGAKLKREQVFLDPHYGSMKAIATAAVGWYYGVYPDAFDMGAKEFQINKELKDKFNDEKEAIMEWCKTHKNIDLQNWDGTTHFPHVTVEMMRPSWRPKDTKNLTTRVVGLRGSTKFRDLLSKLVTEIDLKKGNGEISFVSNDLQYAGQKMFEQYGKIITMQQKVIRDNDHIIIVGMTRYEMESIQTALTSIPGIKSINSNRQTLKQGKWILLTDPNLSRSTLTQIDNILKQASQDKFHPTTMRQRPERIQNDEEKVPEAVQISWAKQSIAITRAMETAPANAWRKSPRRTPTKSTKITWSPDDKSINTTVTTSIDTDRVDQELKRMTNQYKEVVMRLESIEKENNALKNMKQTVKTQIKLNEQYQATTTKHLKNIDATIHKSKETIEDTVANMTIMQNTQNAHYRQIEVIESRQSLIENKLSKFQADTAHSLSGVHSMLHTLINRAPPQDIVPNSESKRSRDTSTLTPEYSSPVRKKNDTEWAPRTIEHPLHSQDINMTDNESNVYDDDDPLTKQL